MCMVDDLSWKLSFCTLQAWPAPCQIPLDVLTKADVQIIMAWGGGQTDIAGRMDLFLLRHLPFPYKKSSQGRARSTPGNFLWVVTPASVHDLTEPYR